MDWEEFAEISMIFMCIICLLINNVHVIQQLEVVENNFCTDIPVGRQQECRTPIPSIEQVTKSMQLSLGAYRS